MRISASDATYLSFCKMLAGYRLLTVVRSAVSLGIIEKIGSDGATAKEILERAGIKPKEGGRFMDLLAASGVVEKFGETFFLSQFSRRYLLKQSELSQLHVLEFERVLMEKWDGLDAVLQQGQGSLQENLPESAYRQRLSLFQKSMHEAASVRSEELWEALPFLPEEGTIIDVGAGDGTYLLSFLRRHAGWKGIACDLPDVLDLATPLAQNPAIAVHPCNILDPVESAAFVARYSKQAKVLLLSNFVHCYSDAENTGILRMLKGLVHEDGVVVVHDFLTDANPFGAQYDGHMLVNTYSGRAYSIDGTKGLLAEAGFRHCHEFHLPSASCAVVACAKPLDAVPVDAIPVLQRQALTIGFMEARAVAVEKIRIEPWVKAKCRYGCGMYGKKWSCPPHSMSADEFKELIGCYRQGLVVVGQPPLRDFQERLLELEKRAFLGGRKKALAFSGGPCTWCESCPEDRCRFPEKRRPSLESCGCDVFDLAASCGINLQPVKDRDDFVQYVGLLLVE